MSLRQRARQAFEEREMKKKKECNDFILKTLKAFGVSDDEIESEGEYLVVDELKFSFDEGSKGVKVFCNSNSVDVLGEWKTIKDLADIGEYLEKEKCS